MESKQHKQNSAENINTVKTNVYTSKIMLYTTIY